MALPSGYTQLEYIESNGSQYIDTGFGSTRGWTAEFDWMFTVSPVSEQDIIGSVLISGSTYYREYVLCRDNQWSLGHYSNYAYSGSAAANTKYSIKASTVSGNGYLTVNGTQVHKFTTTYQSHAAHNVYVFAMNVSGAEGFASGRLSYLRLRDQNGTLVRNYIPCKNASGVAGLWDDVNSKFYGSAGSEPFVAGTILDPMAPHDGHNTNVGNVAREIEGGTALIGGVLRETKSGLVLVNGVVREIAFGSSEATVTITGSGSSFYLYLTIDGTTYDTAATVVVPVGTIISCYARRSSGNGSVVLNGTTVASGRPASYEYEVTGNVTIKLTYSSYSTAKIEITEE